MIFQSKRGSFKCKCLANCARLPGNKMYLMALRPLKRNAKLRLADQVGRLPRTHLSLDTLPALILCATLWQSVSILCESHPQEMSNFGGDTNLLSFN